MAKIKKLNLPPLIPHYWLCLLTEFEVCNLSYVTGFFHSDLWPKHKGVGHKSGGEKYGP